MKLKTRNRTALLLSVLGAAGTVLTAYSAAKATEKYSEQHTRDKPKVLYYIPTIAIGTGTVICIFGSNAMSRRTQSALVSTCGFLSSAYTDYQQKVIGICGENVHKRIMTELAAEKASNPFISCSGFASVSSLDIGEAEYAEKRLFYDEFSKQYFEAPIEQVIQAEYHLNRNFLLKGGCISVNEFYDFIGISPMDKGDDYVWYVNDCYQWVDFNHRKVTLEDGLECICIEFVWNPELYSEELFDW